MSKPNRKKQTHESVLSRTKKNIASVVPKFMVRDTILIGRYKIAARSIFFASIVMVGIFMIAGALQTGVSADEPIDYAYGQDCLHYFSTFGRDTSFADLALHKSNFPDQKYYGAAFEMIAPLLNGLLKLHNPFPIHHVLSALAGLVLLLFTGLIAQRLKGWAAGLLALWMIFLTPVVSGNAFFNSKDVPFAAAFAAGFYFFIIFLERLPVISHKAFPGIAVSVAAAVSIRVSGILLPAYLILFAAIWHWRNSKQLKPEPHLFGRYFLTLISELVVGVLAGLVTYPNFWHDTIHHITGALAATKKFQHNIMMLYNDQIISSQKITTSSYLIKYIFITVPEVVLAGFLLSTFVLIFYKTRFKHEFTWMLLFAAIFPFAYVMIANVPLYNGWRHVMFAFPFVVSASALGLTEFINLIKPLRLRYGFGTAIMLLLVQLLVWQIRAFPFNYAYYNSISGGVSGKYKHYDIDYQQLSAHEGVQWLLSNQEALSMPLTILSNNSNSLQCEHDSSIVKFKHVSIRDMWLIDWNYAVVTTRFLTRKEIEIMFPPDGTIHTVERFGVPLSFVVKRASRDDIKIYNMMMHDSLRYAGILIDRVFQNNKTNTMGIYWKAYSLFYEGKYNESLQLMKQYDEIFPNQNYVYELIGYDYYSLHQWDKAFDYLHMVYVRSSHKETYNQILGSCLVNLGREQEAQFYLQQSK